MMNTWLLNIQNSIIIKVEFDYFQPISYENQNKLTFLFLLLRGLKS